MSRTRIHFVLHNWVPQNEDRELYEDPTERGVVQILGMTEDSDACEFQIWLPLKIRSSPQSATSSRQEREKSDLETDNMSPSRPKKTQ